MTTDRDTPSGKPNLLPPSSPLLPPSGSHMRAGDANIDAARELARAAAEARELGTKAARLAAEKAPEVRQAALEATARMGDFAASSAANARKALADGGLRGFLRTNRTVLAIGAVLLAAAVAGGWTYARHQATSLAKTRIDAFLRATSLADTVRYETMSASPFGTVVLESVHIDLSETAAITARSVTISDIETRGDDLLSVHTAVQDLKLPLLELAKESRGNGPLRDAVGLGYRSLDGDVAFSFRHDDQDGTVSFVSSGTAADAGTWDMELALGGVGTETTSTLRRVAQAAAESQIFGLMAEADNIRRALGPVTLISASLRLDDTAFFKRAQDIPSTDMPQDAATPRFDLGLDDAAMVNAGMAPEESKAALQALDTWLRRGGTLRIESNLAQPLPLFRRNNRIQPAVTTLSEYVALTRSTISN